MQKRTDRLQGLRMASEGIGLTTGCPVRDPLSKGREQLQSPEHRAKLTPLLQIGESQLRMRWQAMPCFSRRILHAHTHTCTQVHMYRCTHVHMYTPMGPVSQTAALQASRAICNLLFEYPANNANTTRPARPADPSPRCPPPAARPPAPSTGAIRCAAPAGEAAKGPAPDALDALVDFPFGVGCQLWKCAPPV